MRSRKKKCCYRKVPEKKKKGLRESSYVQRGRERGNLSHSKALKKGVIRGDEVMEKGGLPLSVALTNQKGPRR